MARKSPPPPPAPLVSDGAVMLLVLTAVVAWLAITAPPEKAGSISARRVYCLSALLLAGATLALTTVESGISTIDAFYLSTMTFTTIGYGDIPHPATTAGRAVVMALALGGIAFFATTIELFHSRSDSGQTPERVSPAQRARSRTKGACQRQVRSWALTVRGSLCALPWLSGLPAWSATRLSVVCQCATPPTAHLPRVSA